jgi:hypothetical protein
MKPTKLPTLQKPKTDWAPIIGGVLAWALFAALVTLCAYLVVSIPAPTPKDVLSDSCGNGVVAKDGCVVRKPLKGNVK